MIPFEFGVHYWVGGSLHFKIVKAFSEEEVAKKLGIKKEEIYSCKILDGI